MTHDFLQELIEERIAAGSRPDRWWDESRIPLDSIDKTTVGILFGGFAVVLAVPLVAVIVTVIDVVVRDKDPAEEDVPAVLFPAKEAET